MHGIMYADLLGQLHELSNSSRNNWDVGCQTPRFQNDCWDDCLLSSRPLAQELFHRQDRCLTVSIQEDLKVTGGPGGLCLHHTSGHCPPEATPLGSASFDCTSGHRSCYHTVHLLTYVHHRPWLQTPVQVTAGATKWKKHVTIWVVDLPGDRGAGPGSDYVPVPSGHAPEGTTTSVTVAWGRLHLSIHVNQDLNPVSATNMLCDFWKLT